MSHVIHSINSTINGCCDHRHVIADEEHHVYAADLINSADALLFGRNTFDLLENFWPSAAERSDLPNYMVQLAKSINGAKKYVSSSGSLENGLVELCADLRRYSRQHEISPGQEFWSTGNFWQP